MALRGILSRFRRDESPLKAPEAMADGITHGPGGLWAWVVIPGRSTDELNTRSIFRMTSEGANDLRRLIPSGAEFHFKIQWGRWSGEDYRREEIRPGMPPGTTAWINLGAERIDENRYARRIVLLGVRMDAQDEPATAALLKKAGRVAGTTNPREAAAGALSQSLKRSRTWFDRMAESSFKARPATTQELSWSLRRDLRRTVDWLPTTAVADSGQLVRLKATQVVPHRHHVEISSDHGPRYLRMVTTSERGFPTSELELPGGEWLKHLNIVRQDLDAEDDESAPVEVSIRGRNVPQKEAAKRLRDALALSKEQEREARSGMAEDAPDQIQEAGQILRERLREVTSGLIGMITDSPVWVIEASDLEVLDRRTNNVIDDYGARGITLWSPPDIQDLLWKELVIGDGRRITEFEQFRPVSTLVGAWFHGGSEVGSATGPYTAGNIGSTPGPYRNRLTDAQLEGNAVTSAYVGKSGSGKSTGVELSLIPEIVLGAWGALTDFKGDLDGCADVCEMYGANVTRISTGEQASGSMCPFRYVSDPSTAASMAVDNLTMMLPPSEAAAAESTLRQAANVVAHRPDPSKRSTYAIIETLANNERDEVAARIGQILLELTKDPLARPVAGPPDLTARQLPTGPGLVYMRFDDMRWPGRQTPQHQWKPGQRLTCMLVQAAFAYLVYMASRVKGLPKIVALTELHLITGYDFGQELVGSIARLGRALDENLLLDTQAVAELVDIPGLVDQISAAYCFGVDSDGEADAQAVLLGLEPEPAVRARQKSWAKGQCMTRDRAKRIAPIQFDYLSSEIKVALNTTPERQAQTEWEEIEVEAEDQAEGAANVEMEGAAR